MCAVPLLREWAVWLRDRLAQLSCETSDIGAARTILRCTVDLEGAWMKSLEAPEKALAVLA